MSKTDLTVTKPEEYSAIAAETDDRGELVKMPSGAVFRLRRVDVEGLVLIGELPQSLVTEGLSAWHEQASPVKEAKVGEVDADEEIRKLIFVRQTVVDNCLEPRIGYSESGVVSLLAADGRAIAKLQKQDFKYAFKWITSQVGVEAGGLNTFRNRQERRAVASVSRRQKLRNTPVETAAS